MLVVVPVGLHMGVFETKLSRLSALCSVNHCPKNSIMEELHSSVRWLIGGWLVAGGSPEGFCLPTVQSFSLEALLTNRYGTCVYLIAYCCEYQEYYVVATFAAL